MEPRRRGQPDGGDQHRPGADAGHARGRARLDRQPVLGGGQDYSPIVACHYAASKAGLIGFTKHLAASSARSGIRVNAIAPGRIETPMVRAVGRAVNDEQARLTPMGRLGAPEEVADLALYLTSAEASFVTGQTVDVAGGLYMT